LQKDGQDDKIMQDALIFHLAQFMSTHITTTAQMLQIVTLHDGYLYRIAHFCIINLTNVATWFNNFVVLNISW